MAAIGRLARLAVRFSSHTRHFPVRCQSTSNCLLKKSQLHPQLKLLWQPTHTASCRFSTSLNFTRRENVDDTRQNFGETLFIFDDQAKKGGVVDPYALNRCLSMLRSISRVAPDQALSLIRASGRVLQQPVEERRRAFDTVWKCLQGKNVPFDISHYNAVLKLKIRNQDVFKPAEFLSELQGQGLTPNRPTYQLLVDKHCEDGDIDGAREMIDIMKSHQMPVNRVVYESLIKGHMKKGDVEAATAVIEDMRDAGLEANGDTYKVLMCGYAEQGDITALKQTLATAKEEDVYLHPQLLLDVVYTLGAHGHTETMEEMLQEVTDTTQRYHFMMQTCMAALVANGNVAEAYRVWQCVQRTSDNPRRSNSFVKTLVLGGSSVDTVVEYVDRLTADGQPCDDLDIVTICAFIMRDEKYFFELVEKLNEKPNYNVKMFTVKLRRDFNFGDLESVYATVGAIFKVVSAPDVEIREKQLVMLLYREAWAKLSAAGHENSTISTRFKESGVPEDYIIQLEILVNLQAGRYEEALEHLDQVADLPLAHLKTSLPQSFPTSGHNVSGLVQVLKQLGKNLKQQPADLNSVILLNIVENSTPSETANIENLLESFIEEEIHLRANYQAPLYNALKELGFSKEFISKTDSLYVTTGVGLPFARNPKSITRVDDLKAALASDDEQNKAAILRRLVAASVQNGKLEEALQYKTQMLSDYPQFIEYDYLVLPLAMLQVKEGKTSEAIQTLEDYISHVESTETQLTLSYKPAESAELVKLTIEHSSLADARHMADCLYKLGFVKHDPTVPVMLTQAHMERGDLDGLVDTFEHCAKNQILPPNYRQILTNLIQNEDAVKLQKVVDLLTSSMVEAEVMVQLAFCFIACGKVKQARKLLQIPGLQLGRTSKTFRNECQNLVGKDKDDELAHVVEETRGLPGVDRDEILFQVIRLHAKTKDTVKALDVLDMYEEEGLTPKPRTKRYLAKFLVGEGQHVPFVVPKAPERSPLRDEVDFDPQIKETS